MNTFETALLLNQSIQTAQLNAINARLAAQEQLMAQAQSDRERLDAARRAIFDFRTTLEELSQDIGEPTWIYYQLRYAIHALAWNGITAKTFSEFRDLEYYRQVMADASSLEATLLTKLPEGAATEIASFVRMDRVVRTYALLAVITQIVARYPGRLPSIVKLVIYVAVGFGVFWTLCALGVMGGFYSLLTGLCASYMTFQFLMKTEGEAVDGVAKPLLAPFNWTLENTSKQALIGMIQANETRLESLGFVRYNPPDYPQAYANACAVMRTTIERYKLHLQLALPVLPQ